MPVDFLCFERSSHRLARSIQALREAFDKTDDVALKIQDNIDFISCLPQT